VLGPQANPSRYYLLQCASNQAETEGNDHSGHDRCQTLSHRALAYRPIFVRSAVKRISGTSANGSSGDIILHKTIISPQFEAEYYLTGDQ
jgi:hypothetical protein